MTIYKVRPKTKQRQSGAIIVLTLFVLLVVTMLGMATMDTTGMEMRMASNSSDQQAAFEAAEYTLSFVENNILTNGFSADSLANNSCGTVCFEPTCSNGYCFDGNDPNDWALCQLDVDPTQVYEDSTLWANGSGRHLTLAVPGTAMTAKYIIEYLCYTADDPTAAMDIANNARMFRITAYVIGENGRSRVMIRSVIKES